MKAIGKIKVKRVRRPLDNNLIDPDFLDGLTVVEVRPKESIDPSILKSITNWT
jgi:hypothetical protein